MSITRPIFLSALALLCTTASADESQLSMGVDAIHIQYVTPTLYISVSNVSGSSDAAERELMVTSEAPIVELDGQVFCDAIFGGTTRLDRAELLFGNPLVNGNDLWAIGVWNTSDPQFFGNVDAADMGFQHTLDLPATWEGGFTIGLNPVEHVEAALALYIDNGGSEVDFLREDVVVEAPVQVNLAAQCTNTSSYGVTSYAGLTSHEITAVIFYHGDLGIQAELTAVDTPDDVAAPAPELEFIWAPKNTRRSRR